MYGTLGPTRKEQDRKPISEYDIGKLVLVEGHWEGLVVGITEDAERIKIRWGIWYYWKEQRDIRRIVALDKQA